MADATEEESKSASEPMAEAQPLPDSRSGSPAPSAKSPNGKRAVSPSRLRRSSATGERNSRSSSSNAAVLQAQGALGAASCIDDEKVLPVRILLYRLVALPNPDSPWGDGMLLDIARSTDDDGELLQKLMAFLDKNWRDDPVRDRLLGRSGVPASDSNTSPAMLKGGGMAALRLAAKLGAMAATRQAPAGSGGGDENNWTWAEVLVNGRGTVGEAGLCAATRLEPAVLTAIGAGGCEGWRRSGYGARASAAADGTAAPTSAVSLRPMRLCRHLLCLLATPQHLRIVRALVPWLAKQRCADVDGIEVNCLDASYLGQPYNGEVHGGTCSRHHTPFSPLRVAEPLGPSTTRRPGCADLRSTALACPGFRWRSTSP